MSNKNHDNDPLTKAILSSADVAFSINEGESVFVQKGEEDELTRALFARLDSSQEEQKHSDPQGSGSLQEKARHDLSSKKAQLADLPKKHKKEDIRTRILNTIENTPHAELADIEQKIVHRPLPKRKKNSSPQATLANVSSKEKPKSQSVSISKAAQEKASPNAVNLSRAQEDWFSSYRKSKQSRAQFADLSSQKKDTPSLLQQQKKRYGRRLFLAGIALVVLVGGSIFAWNAAGGAGHFFSRVTTTLNHVFSLDNTKLLGSGSFVLRNAENIHTFKPLANLYKETEQIHSELLAKVEAGKIPRAKGTQAAERIMQSQQQLESFFARNENFSWLSVFRLLSSGSPENHNIIPKAFDNAQAAAQTILSITREHNLSFSGSSQKVQTYLKEASFWIDALNTPGTWLLVATQSERQSIGMGEPAAWAEVQVTDAGVSLKRSGGIAELNAALNAKIIPPTPLRAQKTSFDFTEAGWFFNTDTSADLLSRLYEKTTGTQLRGVVVLEESFLQSLSQMQGLRFSVENPELFSVLLQNLSQYQARQWPTLKKALSAAVERRRLLIRPQKAELAESRPSRYSGAPSADTRDVITWGVRSWQEGVETGMAQYEPQFHEDGSVVGVFSLSLTNTSSAQRPVYISVAVPAESSPLGQEGFSAPLEPAAFDYSGHGFSSFAKVNQPQKTAVENLFASSEGALGVLGGWVRLSPGEERTVVVSYRLPFRLNWRAGVDTYSLAVQASGAKKDVPFQFSTTLQEGRGFSWQEPKGFVSESLAEYQTDLNGDLILRGEVLFE